MKARDTAKIKTPVSFDDKFFDRVSEICDFIRERSLPLVATEAGVSLEQVRSVLSGDVAVDGLELHNARLIKAAFKNLSGLNIKIKYRGSRTFTVKTIDDAKLVLDTEYGITDEFDLDCGSMAGLYFNINADQKYRTVSYDARGDREAVAILYTMLTDLLYGNKPKHPVLHSRLAPMFVRILMSFSLAFIFLSVVFYYRTGLGSLYPSIVNAVSIPFFLGLAVGADPLVNLYTKAFPFCQFEFGQQKKEREAKQGLTLFILTAFAIPIALSFLKLT